MNKIFYFSGSGKSKRLANFLGKEVGAEVFDLTKTSDYTADLAIIVFPVYCQNLPDPVIPFLRKLKTKKVSFVALYGRKSFGNVIEDAVKITDSDFIGGVCVPCGHSFLLEKDDFDYKSFKPFIERIKNPISAKPKHYNKSFYADFFPANRTQICVKIYKNENCINCGKCSENCPMGAMDDGKINRNCIRCLRCVSECPENALQFKINGLLKLYLINSRKNEYKYFF